MCVLVSGMHFWLREVTWLNFTPNNTFNNPYIVQRNLIISEYSKHSIFKAFRVITLRARIDLLMTVWLLRWICSAVSWKCSRLYIRRHRILYSLNAHIMSKTFSNRQPNIAKHLKFRFSVIRCKWQIDSYFET